MSIWVYLWLQIINNFQEVPRHCEGTGHRMLLKTETAINSKSIFINYKSNILSYQYISNLINLDWNSYSNTKTWNINYIIYVRMKKYKKVKI